jgi:Cof subfamily protein (haloacid dehalogenase superfamily)
MNIKEIKNKLKINPDTKKCFIFDLDGTIVFESVMLSPTNENIIQKIIDHGHEVIFATGRSYRDFKIVMPTMFHNHKATLFSGALSRDVDGEIRRSMHVPRACVEEIVELCLKHETMFIMDNISHYYHPPTDDTRLGFIDSQLSHYRIENIEKMLGTDIYKILVLDMKLHEMFTEYARDNDLVIKHHSYDGYFDIVINGCNKYDGVLPLIGDYANEDIFVFGNDFNDYEMLSNFQNSVVFGSIKELIQISKLNIVYDQYRAEHFKLLIDTILCSSDSSNK